MAKSSRSRYWGCLVYPESAPENFISILQNAHVFFLCSPLHDRDLDEQGQLKKPHYHLMLCFDGPTSDSVARDIFLLIGGVGCERIVSSTSYARYLCHLDDDEKAAYEPSGVVSYGVDYDSYCATADSRYTSIGAVFRYCADNHICNFAGLLLDLAENDAVLFRVVCDNAYLIRSFLQDFRKEF